MRVGHDVVKHALSIPPAYFGTSSLIIFAVLVTAAGIAIIIYVRVRMNVKRFVRFEKFKAEEEMKIRRELARDFHDELGNHLTRIITYVNLVRLNRPELTSDQYLVKLEDSAKSLIIGTRDFISSIDSQKNDLPGLFAAIRDFGENLFYDSPVAFRTRYVNPEMEWKISNEFHRQMILIFKEILTNAFKHSEASNVFFLIKEWNGTLEISLQDDGVGFQQENVVKPGGLENLRLRAKRINADIHISSEPGLRTYVRLFYQHTV